MPEPFRCPKGDPPAGCGQMHERCAAHSKRAGGAPCKGRPLDGSDKCRIHAGRKAEVVRAEYVAGERAREAFARNGIDPDSFDPLTQLIKVAAEAERWREACGQLVARSSHALVNRSNFKRLCCS